MFVIDQGDDTAEWLCQKCFDTYVKPVADPEDIVEEIGTLGDHCGLCCAKLWSEKPEFFGENSEVETEKLMKRFENSYA